MTQIANPVRIRRLVGFGMVGQVTYLLSQFLTLIALSRFASVEDVGAFGLASAVVIPVFFFFGLRMQVNVASGQDSEFAYNDFKALLALSVTVGYALVLVIGTVAFPADSLALLAVIGIAKAAETFSQMAYGMFQRHDRMGLVAASLSLRGVASTAAFVTVLWQGGAVVQAFAAQAAIWIALAFAVDQPLARRLAARAGDTAPASRERMRSLVGTSLYLAFSGLLSALQGNMPRYVIANLLGVLSLGYFTVVGYAMQAIATLVGTVTESLVSRLALYMSKGQGEALIAVLRRLSLGIVALAIVGIGGSLWIGDWLVEAVFGAQYRDMGILLALCLLASSLQAVVLTLQTYLMAARQFRRIVLIRIGTTTAMLLCCAAGGMLGGLPGVVLGMSAAFCIHITALAIPVRALILANHEP